MSGHGAQASLEHTLRSSGVGTWKTMPNPEIPDWTKGNQGRGITSRMSPDILWRVTTRNELVGHFHNVSQSSFKNVSIAVVSGIAGLLSLNYYLQSRDLTFAFFAILFAALVSRHYTKAIGGYAGGWSDYENDPVQTAPTSNYVLTGGKGLM